MNEKGFTLIEILVVITVLAIIIIIAMPSVSNIFNQSKAEISELNKKSIKDAAEMLATDMYLCSPSSNIVELSKEILGKTDISCKDIREALNVSGIEVTIRFLKEKDYLVDTSTNCNDDGKITIIKEEENYVATLHSNIVCN